MLSPANLLRYHRWPRGSTHSSASDGSPGGGTGGCGAATGRPKASKTGCAALGSVKYVANVWRDTSSLAGLSMSNARKHSPQRVGRSCSKGASGRKICQPRTSRTVRKRADWPPHMSQRTGRRCIMPNIPPNAKARKAKAVAVREPCRVARRMVFSFMTNLFRERGPDAHAAKALQTQTLLYHLPSGLAYEIIISNVRRAFVERTPCPTF